MSARPRGFDPFTDENYDTAGILSVGRGALIDLDPLANPSLTSSSSILVDGTLSALGGNISLTITADLPIAGFLRAQGIWLGNDSHLLAAGTPQLKTDNRGLLTGTVLDGGNITLTANRGYIVTASRSEMNVAGASADLNASADATAGTAPLIQVASTGGSISLISAEGMLLNGSMLAQGGSGTAAGGSLTVKLDPTLRGARPFASGPLLLSLEAREIRIGRCSAGARSVRAARFRRSTPVWQCCPRI